MGKNGLPVLLTLVHAKNMLCENVNGPYRMVPSKVLASILLHLHYTNAFHMTRTEPSAVMKSELDAQEKDNDFLQQEIFLRFSNIYKKAAVLRALNLE